MSPGPAEPSAGERLRLGIVGAGAVARDYLAVLAGQEELAVAGVADPDAAARACAAQSSGAPTFASAAEMLREVRPDAALVLTPPAAHEANCHELLSRGVHVLCEKPIATSAAAAQRMFHTASRAGVALMMASKFRYVPDVVEAQRLVASGALGDVVLYDNAFCSRIDMSKRWNADVAVSGGGVLIDNGSHAVDVARCLLGPLVRVLAHFGRRTSPVRVEDTVRILVESASAVVGAIDLSWTIDKGSDWYVNLQGTRGTLQLGWRQSRCRLAGDGEWRAFGSGYDKRAAFASQLRNFAGVVAGREKPVVTAEDAVESARTIEAAYRSARVARWVPVHGGEGGS